jgi:GAF domain-containing protein
MTAGLTLQELALPIVLALAYVLLVAVVVARWRRLRGREAGSFVACLALSACWFLLAGRDGLHALGPADLLDRLAISSLVLVGVVFWAFGRAFLQRPPLGIAAWISAALAAALVAVLDAGLIEWPSAELVEEVLLRFAAPAVPAIYAAVAIVTALSDYARRPSPLHRNRITYWFLGALAVVAGIALIHVTSLGGVRFAGIGIHFLGAMLLTYTVVRPQLPNIGTGVRRLVRFFLMALFPAAVVIAVGAGAGSLLGVLSLPGVLDVLVVGAAAFFLYQPVSSLTRRVVNRLLFGRGHETPAVVREYGQAVTGMLSLELLVETAMAIIDRAIGVRRGTLLVVEDARADGWSLRVIEGLDVAAGRPDLLLAAGTPLAEWLVERGDPLYQYTLDVDPRFDVLDPADHQAWRELDMEVFVPIRRSDTFVGLLAVGLRRSGRPYGGSDLELLQTLADQTAVALENSTLFDSVQRRAEQLALLNEVGRVITSSLDLDSAVDQIAGRTADVFAGAAGYIFLLDESRNDLLLRSTFGREVAGEGADPFRVELGQGLAGWVASESRPVLVVDVARDSRYSPDVEGILAPGAESVVCVPVTARGRTSGVILVASPSRTGLGGADLSLLDSIASFASIAIENARQVAAREARLQSQVRALRIEIDEMKREQHVEEITDTDYFRTLKAQARQMRKERAGAEKKSLFDRLQEEVDKRDEEGDEKEEH